MVLAGRLASCPAWCTVPHGRHPGEDTSLHLGGMLMVRGTVLRLCSRDGGGARVLIGAEEFSLHEADALVSALTQLVDLGSGSAPAQDPEGALAVLHAQLAQDAGHVDPHGGR